MSWPPGTIVVCVDAKPTEVLLQIDEMKPPLVEGAYYTIRKTESAFPFEEGRHMAVWVNECTRKLTRLDSRAFHPDAPFGHVRFRLAETTQDELVMVEARSKT